MTNLIKLALSLPSSKKGTLEKLDPKILAELQKLKDAYLDGTLNSEFGQPPSFTALHNLVCEEFGPVMGRTTFSSWMRSKHVTIKQGPKAVEHRKSAKPKSDRARV